ncbi:MAG: hypothetical protein Q7O66_11155, partial [Dehalococcoidia bacterium]|nr:hypothetical protein [Dehalococcoidia bacterium]
RIAQDRQSGRNLRVTIESTIASLKSPYNYCQLPVRGLFRVSMVLIGCAAMANVRRIHRYISYKRTEARVALDEKAYRGLKRTPFTLCLCSLIRFIMSLGSYRRPFHAYLLPLFSAGS